MNPGVVVSFDKEHGFGFIRSRAYPEDVFVHARTVQGGRLLTAGQRVRFSAEPSERGPRAIRVEPGKIGLTPHIARELTLALVLILATLTLHLALGWNWPSSWIAAINPVTFLAFAIDKRNATVNARRVSEKTLLFLALIGGSPAASVAMPLLHHKTRKTSFRLAFAAVVAAQIASAATLWWLLARNP